MNHLRNSFLTTIFTNLMAIIGYWYFNWPMVSIVYLYWVEGVIGVFFNGFKMLKAEGEEQLPDPSNKFKWVMVFKISMIKLAVYLFYWVFILVFVGLKNDSENGINNMMIIFFRNKEFNFLVLTFIIHQCVDVFFNFYYNGEYKKKSINYFKTIFDVRILVIHVVIVLGVFASEFLSRYKEVNAKLPGLAFVVILVGLKLIAELFKYKKLKNENNENPNVYI